MTPDAWVAAALFAASWLTIAVFLGHAWGRAAGKPWPEPTQPDPDEVYDVQLDTDDFRAWESEVSR